MKKVLAIILALALVLGLAGCGSSTEKAEKIFNKIRTAESLIETYSDDIMKAWSKGINDEKDIKGYYQTKTGYYYYTYHDNYDYEKGLKNFAEGFNISGDDILKGVAYAYYGESYTEQNLTFTAAGLAKTYEKLFDRYGNTFSACIDIIVSAYTVNGKTSSIRASLDVVRNEMKKMSENNPDSPYYEDLKEYYVNTMAFFDFCKEPDGSYDTASGRIAAYKTNGKTYYYNLYCFLDTTE